MPQIDDLVADAWSQYARHETEGTPWLVRPALPILFFGDRDAYCASGLRVLTVGLNPSRVEFPPDSRFARFPLAADLHPGIVDGDGYQRYLAALNAYFRTDPYRSWFNAFEPILNGLGASYYDGSEDRALHTDLCSPLATDPTWTGLTRAARDTLIEDGTSLWHRLVRALEPDVVLVSVARRHLDAITFRQIGEPRVAYVVDRERPLTITSTDLDVADGRRTTLVFGRAAQTPFGTISARDKLLIGSALREQTSA